MAPLNGLRDPAPQQGVSQQRSAATDRFSLVTGDGRRQLQQARRDGDASVLPFFFHQYIKHSRSTDLLLTRTLPNRSLQRYPGRC